jgi:hypothetical protein
MVSNAGGWCGQVVPGSARVSANIVMLAIIDGLKHVLGKDGVGGSIPLGSTSSGAEAGARPDKRKKAAQSLRGLKFQGGKARKDLRDRHDGGAVLVPHDTFTAKE